MDNYNTYVSLLSRVSPKNPYNTTGLGDSIVTSPIEALLSTITANFGKISQNDANFTARVSLDTAQKINFSGGVGWVEVSYTLLKALTHAQSVAKLTAIVATLPIGNWFYVILTPTSIPIILIGIT